MLYAITLTWPKDSVYLKNIDFLKNSRLKSHQNCFKPTYRTELQ